jgi:hypothetical protein
VTYKLQLGSDACSLEIDFLQLPPSNSGRLVGLTIFRKWSHELQAFAVAHVDHMPGNQLATRLELLLNFRLLSHRRESSAPCRPQVRRAARAPTSASENSPLFRFFVRLRSLPWAYFEADRGWRKTVDFRQLAMRTRPTNNERPDTMSVARSKGTMKAARSGKPRGIARPNTSAKVLEIGSVHVDSRRARRNFCV